jgi:hypothetical protein
LTKVTAAALSERIAAILDKADAIWRKREHSLALPEDFLRSAYLTLVGLKNPGYATRLRQSGGPYKNCEPDEARLMKRSRAVSQSNYASSIASTAPIAAF